MKRSSGLIISIVVALLGSAASAQPAGKPVGLTFARGAGLATAAVTYLHGGIDSNEANQSFVYPVDVVLRNLATVCKVGANPGPLAAGRFIFDVTADSVSTGLQTGCDTNDWVTREVAHASPVIRAGQFVTLRATPLASPSMNTQLFASWQTFDSDGESPLVFIEGGGGFTTPADGQHCDIMKGSCNFASAAAAARVAAVAFSVDKLSVTLGSAPAAGNSETYCLRNVTTGMDVVCTAPLTSTGRAVISEACTANCAIAAGDAIAMRVAVVGVGRPATRHFAIHVLGASTQILYAGTSGSLLAGAGPIGVDFTTSPQLAGFPVATPVIVSNLYALADSNGTQTIRVAASGNCDDPMSGEGRPSCDLAGERSCSDMENQFDLHGLGCFRIEHTAGGTFGLRIRGGLELSQGPPSCPVDCNSDDLVSVEESIYAIETVLGLRPPSGCRDADANQDDVVTIEDLVVGNIGSCQP